MATNQFIHFSIVLYQYPTQDLLLMLGVEEYAFIEHNYDLWIEGEKKGQLKDTHYHLYVKLRKKKTISGVFNILNKWKENCTQSFLIVNLSNVPNFIRYLVHKDDSDKYQYDISEIITNMDLSIYFDLQMSDLQFTTNVIQLISEGKLKYFKELVSYCIPFGKLNLVMKRAYFFKMLF